MFSTTSFRFGALSLRSPAVKKKFLEFYYLPFPRQSKNDSSARSETKTKSETLTHHPNISCLPPSPGLVMSAREEAKTLKFRLLSGYLPKTFSATFLTKWAEPPNILLGLGGFLFPPPHHYSACLPRLG
ncbi:hypothetical protein AVEN_46198-1 [Araneus ventricosus]|uniref:Uncharacterized protein n=1 Tax=Araneus ventricosus TaxID=182803 RepID=A0A4Y2E6D4_ARAVE|nr:hypothetical protein AVEN_46198-1 [Araneus ventricosus]